MIESVDTDGDGFDEDEDCDDGDASVYPGAPEVPNDGIDQDCDGQDSIVPIDLDGDGFDTEMSIAMTKTQRFIQVLQKWLMMVLTKIVTVLI